MGGGGAVIGVGTALAVGGCIGTDGMAGAGIVSPGAIGGAGGTSMLGGAGAGSGEFTAAGMATLLLVTPSGSRMPLFNGGEFELVLTPGGGTAAGSE